MRAQIASIKAPGGYSILIDAKEKIIHSLSTEVALYVETINKLREDKQQNARDLAAKVQQVAQMDRHRKECERLQISNRHLAGNQAELKAQIDDLKADNMEMSKKIAFTKKLVTELSESLAVYAAREDQTLGGSGGTPEAPSSAPSWPSEVARVQEQANLASVYGLMTQLRDVEAEVRDRSSVPSADVQSAVVNEPRIATTMDVALKDLQDCINSLTRRIRDREVSHVEKLDTNKQYFDVLISTLEQEKVELRKEADRLKKAAADEALVVGYMQTRYEEEKTNASTYLKENARLRTENEAARSQATDGVKQARIFYQTTVESLKEELDQLQAENRFLIEKERRGACRSVDDSMIEGYGALQRDLEFLTADAVFWKRRVSRLAGSRAEVNGVDTEASDEDGTLPSQKLADVLDHFKALKASAEEFKAKYNAFKKFEGPMSWEDSISRLVDIGLKVDLENDILPSVVADVVERYHESERRYRRAKRIAELLRSESRLQEDDHHELQPEPRTASAPSPPPTPASPTAKISAPKEQPPLAPDVGDGVYTWNMAGRPLTTEQPVSQSSHPHPPLLPPHNILDGNNNLKNGSGGTNPEISLDMEEEVYPCPTREDGKHCMKDFPSVAVRISFFLDTLSS